jgi:hypothetical protein
MNKHIAKLAKLGFKGHPRLRRAGGVWCFGLKMYAIGEDDALTLYVFGPGGLVEWMDRKGHFLSCLERHGDGFRCEFGSDKDQRCLDAEAPTRNEAVMLAAIAALEARND